MLEEKVLNDYKEAMKSKDGLKSTLLSFLRAQFINLAVEKKKKNLDDNDCIVVIRKQCRDTEAQDREQQRRTVAQ
mgnify:CR=1 FL=1